MGLTTQHLHVHGMRCTSCENIVERALRHLRGVRKAKADYGNETVVVTYDDTRCNLFKIAQALETRGYECSLAPKRRPFLDGLLGLLRVLAGLAGIIALLYIGKRIPSVEAWVGLDQKASVGLLFLAGFLTSFHCVGMCGGFIVGYTAHNANAGRTAHAFAHLAYGVGKTFSYTAIGALFGLVGSLISFTPTMKGAAAILAGVFLLGFGLNMLHLLPHLKLFGLPMPRWLSRIVQGGFRKHHNPFVIGLLNGLMIACGPLQAMYVMAAGTGSPLEGARILLVFGTGTLPLLLGFGFLASLISHRANYRILQASGLIVAILGVIMLNRGLVLTGTGYDLDSLASRIRQEAAVLDLKSLFLPDQAEDRQTIPSPMFPSDQAGGLQTIRTTVTGEGFEPSTFVLRKGVPVRWILDVKELTECNRAIIVPKLGLQIDLHLGEQTVEFTPKQEGMVLWSCWMGMLRGEFQVIGDAEPKPLLENPGLP